MFRWRGKRRIPSSMDSGWIMMAGTPVLRLMDGRRQHVIDLGDGRHVREFRPADARSIAAKAALGYGLQGTPRLVDVLERDQWTVYASYHPHRPLFHFAMDDASDTEFYVSSTTGEVVQMTTFRQRFLNWMGAVVHWLYPTVLRQHTAVWVQVVIWLTIVSLFLTVIGVYIGLRQFKARHNGRRSPCRGSALWHHFAGLVFGLFALTWLTSGLFSMNPFGALEGRGFQVEHQRLRGGQMTFEHARAFLSAIAERGVAESTVQWTHRWSAKSSTPSLMMWSLMLGVTVCALTGTWIGFQRVARAVRRPFSGACRRTGGRRLALEPEGGLGASSPR
ncbi:MAG: hypothetical protein OXG82_01820 [Gammaproteobacteria bacterium]|nr:hypothetical protein [Gammaproteobacteria bacterium]